MDDGNYQTFGACRKDGVRTIFLFFFIFLLNSLSVLDPAQRGCQTKTPCLVRIERETLLRYASFTAQHVAQCNDVVVKM